LGLLLCRCLLGWGLFLWFWQESLQLVLFQHSDIGFREQAVPAHNFAPPPVAACLLVKHGNEVSLHEAQLSLILPHVLVQRLRFGAVLWVAQELDIGAREEPRGCSAIKAPLPPRALGLLQDPHYLPNEKAQLPVFLAGKVKQHYRLLF
jgi:hypothetical protein